MAAMKRLGMVGNRPHRLAELISCPVCLSVWTAAAAVGWCYGWGWIPDWQHALVYWWAAAAVGSFGALADQRLGR